MDAAQLRDRIEKKEQAIEKINRRIAKWSKHCTEEQINAAKMFPRKYSEFSDYCKKHGIDTESSEPYPYDESVNELRHAYGDLDDAITTINKYKNQLKLVDERNSTEKIGVIVEFLQRYKEEVIEYVEKDIENVANYYYYDSESARFHNDRWSLIKELGEDEWKEQYRQIRVKAKFYKDHANPLSFEVYYKYGKNHISYDRLNEILDKDIEAKYWNMVEKVTKITGEITDASHLRVAGDGNLNGIIIGTDGKARLETILAGGYNQNVIVNVRHGQILHYRLIVTPVR